MAGENIVISKVQGVTTVTLQMTSLLEGPVIEDVGRCLFGLVEKNAIRKLIVDFQNSHHGDFQSIDPKTPEDCGRLVAKRIEGYLR